MLLLLLPLLTRHYCYGRRPPPPHLHRDASSFPRWCGEQCKRPESGEGGCSLAHPPYIFVLAHNSHTLSRTLRTHIMVGSLLLLPASSLTLVRPCQGAGASLFFFWRGVVGTVHDHHPQHRRTGYSPCTTCTSAQLWSSRLLCRTSGRRLTWTGSCMRAESTHRPAAFSFFTFFPSPVSQRFGRFGGLPWNGSHVLAPF